MVLKDIEFKKPLYYFAIPGTVLVASGLLMGARFLYEYTLGQGLNFVPTIVMILFIFVRDIYGSYRNIITFNIFKADVSHYLLVLFFFPLS